MGDSPWRYGAIQSSAEGEQSDQLGISIDHNVLNASRAFFASLPRIPIIRQPLDVVHQTEELQLAINLVVTR